MLLTHFAGGNNNTTSTDKFCQVNPPTGNISACAAVYACSSNITSYSVSSFSSYQTKTIIGLAKDGHLIYGPYLSLSTRVTSGFDACNGMFHDSKGNYAYFATSTYPYLVGCFGPANYPSFGPNCTTNGPTNYTMSSYAQALMNSTVTNSTTTTALLNTTTTTARRANSMSIRLNFSINLLRLFLIITIM
ncbi:unnamed protein product [Adineta ricciae]|uniref:YHYH domain-containing protein n=2 Tax=Adineta ricciae TaxID=249248 RepID=A0A815CEM4_ADIRI|nr:unnamed protein product [Adineta ricciae]